ncbi:MAG: glycosyltransferase [Thermoanaerobaculaceae bacterium]|nr:glycosyltransferase [Thermoanaerobaculaceae bacterium]
MVLHRLASDAARCEGPAVVTPRPGGEKLPSFSILTPSLDHLPYLEVCVASVVAQGYPEVEQIVADGGSSDGTPAYLARLPGRVSRWRSAPDGGQSDALNWAVGQAQGEWIGWQNADDFYLPGALWRAARVIAAHPEVEVVVGDVVLVDEGGVSLGSVGVTPVPSARWLQGFWPYNQGVFLQRRVLEAVGPFDVALRLHMDTDFLARLAARRPVVAYLDVPLGAFRKHAGGKTVGGPQEPESQHERALLEARYGRRLWPRGRVGLLRHRLGSHAARLRHFGVASLLRRMGDRAARGALVRVVA